MNFVYQALSLYDNINQSINQSTNILYSAVCCEQSRGTYSGTRALIRAVKNILTSSVFPSFQPSLWLAGWLVVSRVCLLSRVSVSVRVRAGPRASPARTRPRVACMS